MNIFSFIKSRVSISDVVGEYTTLHKAGNYFKSRCPFHHEKTASFTVSPDKNIFYCFGCHTGGDAISFIAKLENCSQLEAAQFLAERHQIQLPETIDFSEHTQTQEAKLQHYDVCRAFSLWCHSQLRKHPSIVKHLAARGINKTQIDYFSLGFFPGGLSSIKQCIADLKKDHLLADDLMQANIIMQGKSVLYSPFEDRLIFPIKDHLGRFCAFGGRVLKPHDTRPKYYNSRENDFFTKGSLLFGLDCAKKSIQEQKTVFLVEGYTDCIAMVQHNYPNTVATLGTACTEQHLKLLSRYANYLYILYDSDNAGEQAILRLTKLCWHVDMELKVVHLPTGQDPASFLAAGNTLQSRIEQAQDIFEFFIASTSKEFSIKPLHEKVTKLKSIIETIHSIPDPLKRDILLQTASRTFDVPIESLKRELRQHTAPSHQPNSIEPTEPDDPSAASNPSVLEKRIFCAIISNVELLGSQHDAYIVDYISSPLQEILQKLKTKKITNGSFDFADFFDTLNEQDRQYVSKILLEHEEPGDPVAYEHLVLQFQKKQWKQIVRDITTKLTQAQNAGNMDEVQRILDDFHALKRRIVPRYR